MESESIWLSIIIPTYNYASRLPRAIESVLNQLPANCELIVVDDGSDDGTPDVLRSFDSFGTREFRWFRQSNAGAAVARNRGLRECRGEDVLFLDADDELLPGAISVIKKLRIIDPTSTVVLGGHVSRHSDGRERTHFQRRVLPAGERQRVLDYLFHKRINVCHGAMVAKRSMFEQFPYAECLKSREDIPVFVHLVAHGKIAVITEPLVRIYKHKNSLRHSSTMDELTMRALVDAVFSLLPKSCVDLRSAYVAKCYLSMFRSMSKSKNSRLALYYFRKAFRHNMRAALRLKNWKYLLKCLFWN